MDLLLQDPATELAVEKFVACIRVELNPSSSQSERREARMFCESFRSAEPPSKVAAVGVLLTLKTEVEIKFSGLRILEDLVKYHWASLDCREVIKRQLMALLETGFSNAPNQPSFLKEALARTIVEIAKREWPQLWSDLIPVLFELGRRNNLPYVVLRRLFEDISLSQGEDNVPRKRDLLQSLVAIAKDVVPSLLKLLCESLESYSTSQSAVDMGKCKLFLGALVPFIELASLNLFTDENRIVLFFQLLRHPVFKADAAECILQFFQRKSSDKKEKARICIEMLTDLHFANYVEAIREAEKNETHLIRQLCDILAFIGNFCEKDQVSLTKFFSAVDCMASRSEATAVLGALTAFNNFLRGTADGKQKNCLLEPQYSVVLNSIINLIVKKLVSPPVPEEKDEIVRLKCEFCTMLRSTNQVWKKMYVLISPWIIHAINNADGMEVAQWEALGSVLDTVSSTVSCEDEDIVKLGLQHLQQVFMTYSTEENLERKSAMLSNVSGLFIFLTLMRRKREFTTEVTNLMCSIIKSMFQCFSYPESEVNIRRHVAALFIKLSRDNAELFLEMFSSIHQETEHIKHKLTSMEYVSLVEALLITSNRWEEKSQQLNFISSLIIPNEWQEIANICRTPTEFATLFNEQTFYQKKSLLQRNLHLLVAIFNRVQFPAESTFGATSFAEDFFNFIRPTFPVTLELVKTLHSLVLDPNLAVLEDMNASERNLLLGYVDHSHSNDESSRSEKSLKDKLQVFVRSMEDCAYCVLGSCGPKFGAKLYSIPNIVDAFLSYAGSTCAQMNNFQIRRLLRAVFKPFLISCPYEYGKEIIIPFVQQFGTFMVNRLANQWALVNFESLEDENAPSEEAEIINNACLQLLTKDYFDLIVRLLELSNNTKEDLNKTIYEGGGMEMDEDGVPNGHSKGSHYPNSNELGEIGKLLMDDPICQQCVIHLSAQALCWKFSQASLKAARAILLTIKSVWHCPEIVHGILEMSLRSMVMFWTYEANFDSLFRVVDAILVEFYALDPQVLQLLKQWGAPEKDVMKIINLIQTNSTPNMKKRKEVFKAILREHPEIAKQKGPTKQWLSQLPQLFVVNSEKASKKETASKDVDLRECFSLIHIV